MPTLLDTPEFALAKTTLDETLQRIEKARQDRLKFLQDALSQTETELERVKKQALDLPTYIANGLMTGLPRYIANYRAEIARLEATTGADILREAMGQTQTKTQTEAPLWGLDLRTVKFGSDIVIADAGLCDVAMSVALIKKGELFRVEREAMAKADWPDQPRVKIEVVETGYQCFIAAIQPAHVVEPVKHACPRCDEGMRQVKSSFFPFTEFKALRFTPDFLAVVAGSHCEFELGPRSYTFTRPDIPPPSEWCDGSGKG